MKGTTTANGRAQKLNSGWEVQIEGFDETFRADVPFSMYSVLLDNGGMADPYFRENEREATLLSEKDCRFSLRFSIADITADRLYLRFNGVDTVSSISLNGKWLGSTDNMHRTWEYDVTGVARAGENLLEVQVFSPIKAAREKQDARPLWGGFETTMWGYPHIRKAHCMYGWDWGPQLPDMGIWRDVELVSCSSCRLNDVRFSQSHENGRVRISAEIKAESFDGRPMEAWITVTSPGGKTVASGICLLSDGAGECGFEIESPELWYVRGYGEQPLYTICCELASGGEVRCVEKRRIGLRTLTVSREKDEYGEEFCFVCNGIKIFAMGGNYIPEDQIFPRINEERTRRLLERCAAANYNFIRVWGGGFYPDDHFFDCCDEMGFVVWQDFMFACATYLLREDFRATVEAEIIDNVKRIRSHPCLGLWCGNNEIESALLYWDVPKDEEAESDYRELFERMIPSLLAEYDPQTFYWPSSPSSGGGSSDPCAENAGDMHYWAVWHGFKPFEDFENYYTRFCSEYGFESLSDIKTVRAIVGENAPASDYNLNAPVIRCHQKGVLGNEKIMFYMTQMMRLPESFERTVYCSQLVQAECITIDVEHMRRNRGRCMGSAYWQINDSNPVISWSGVDYFGRLKALHYCAARFYAPVLISADISDAKSIRLNVSSERTSRLECCVSWRLRDNASAILASGRLELSVAPLSAVYLAPLELADRLSVGTRTRECYLEYSVEENGEVLSQGSKLFVRPREFNFIDPQISVSVKESDSRFELTLTAKAYAKGVCLSLKNTDAVFSDNWFDIHGSLPVTVSVEKNGLKGRMTKARLLEELEIQSVFG